MDRATRHRLSAAFDRDASGYSRFRPGYPREAARWMGGHSACDVLDLAAGTGELAELLVSAGHRVVAAESSRQMLHELQRHLGDVAAVQSLAERLPFASGSFDVVTVGTAFHWFDAEQALPEIARVLRVGGRLAVCWNSRCAEAGWPRQFDALLRSVQPAGLGGDWGAESARAIGESPRFGGLEYAEFGHVQRLNKEELLGLVATRSYVIALDRSAQAELLAQIGALYDAAALEGDSLELSYRTQCWRARLPC